MTTKIRTTLLTGLFFFGLFASLQAQDKYEYAVIDYFPFGKSLEVSINGLEYKKIEVNKKEIQGNGDVNAALKEISKMSKEGWELFNTTNTSGQTGAIKAYIFYLRKKIN